MYDTVFWFRYLFGSGCGLITYVELLFDYTTKVLDRIRNTIDNRVCNKYFFCLNAQLPCIKSWNKNREDRHVILIVYVHSN